ncbi:transglycosylase domain-containing protein [Evansella tamaricis]|uniref:Penicillin-binding protein n=1 Tax=Evansella tamaricis TaxID=2069301 RepID=A0ABS6JLY9_9BACI|nr:transglycosylase domain-containing protein [Evansella tamaricis]MBU9714673.1 penicillin-binding protein [Evansella tamaricis]
MSKQRFSLNRLLNRKEPQTIFKGVRITSSVVWNLFLIFTILGFMLLFFVGGAGAGYFVSLVKDEPIRSYDDMRRDIYDYEEATEIYFANDDYLGDLPSPLERREISLDEISQYVIDAVIATEDEYFFEHQGIVPKALFRAVYQDFSNAAMQTGGSTLTQQLIKNQILTSEVTHDRKAAEILLALRLENFFEKDEILEAYLNVVFFGRNSSGRQIAGIQAAAQGIFGVDAKDLSLPQAAYIAGLPQSPFGYTPFTSSGEVKENLDPGLNRMRTVLNRMLTAELITEQEHREALAYDVRANLIPPTRNSLDDYPYITDEVRRRARDIMATVLMEEDGINIDEIEDEEQKKLLQLRYREEAIRSLHRDGYKIHTTIDREIYDAHQQVIEDYEDSFGSTRQDTVTNEFGEEEERLRLEQPGSVLLENKTGRILSFVGGRDYGLENLNHATQADRPTGSTMKPLLTYALGFEMGVLQPGFITPDIPYSYPNGDAVTNFEGGYMGLMTIREALVRSRNTPAVREAEKIPTDYQREALVNYNLQRFLDEDPHPYPSTPLGTLAMSVEANTAAYTTFANGGEFIESYFIERIENSNGEVIFEHESEPVEVFSPQTSYLVIDIMRDVLRGTGGTATDIPGYLKFSTDWAGKTGTSQGHRDYWFVGTNPNVTLSLWIGYGHNEPLDRDYSRRLKRLWANIANATYDINPDLIAPSSQFESPGGIVRQSICGISGKLPSELCYEAGFVTTDLFNSKYVPTEVDDSLERVNYVRVDDEHYKALETTPLEFTNEGVSIKEEYFDFGDDVDISEFIPEDWDTLIPDEEAPDNGKTPDELASLNASNNSISWDEHHEGDVIGYRVYYSFEAGADFTLVASVKWDEEFSYSGPEGAYHVTAVDVAGRESSPSEPVILGEYIDPVEEAEREEEERRQREEEERRQREEEEATREDDDDDDDNGNGNGNNGNGNGGNGNGNGSGNGNDNGDNEDD